MGADSWFESVNGNQSFLLQWGIPPLNSKPWAKVRAMKNVRVNCTFNNNVCQKNSNTQSISIEISEIRENLSEEKEVKLTSKNYKDDMGEDIKLALKRSNSHDIFDEKNTHHSDNTTSPDSDDGKLIKRAVEEHRICQETIKEFEYSNKIILDQVNFMKERDRYRDHFKLDNLFKSIFPSIGEYFLTGSDFVQ